jgi:hypothetical protein
MSLGQQWVPSILNELREAWAIALADYCRTLLAGNKVLSNGTGFRAPRQVNEDPFRVRQAVWVRWDGSNSNLEEIGKARAVRQKPAFHHAHAQPQDELGDNRRASTFG